MEFSSKSIVVQQPSNKKYLLEKTVLEMTDQNYNKTNDITKNEPFLIKNQIYPSSSTNEAPTQINSKPKSGCIKVIHLCDGIVELDENGNVIEEVKREKRSLKSVVRHQNYLKIFDSIDSPIIHSATNISTKVGRKTLSAIDYLGNLVASLVGITNSKYNSEVIQANFESDRKSQRRKNVIGDHVESGWK